MRSEKPTSRLSKRKIIEKARAEEDKNIRKAAAVNQAKWSNVIINANAKTPKSVAAERITRRRPIYWETHLAAEGEEGRDDLRNVLLLPQVDRLEDVDVSHAVILQGLLEPVFQDTVHIICLLRIRVHVSRFYTAEVHRENYRRSRFNLARNVPDIVV